MKLCDSRMSLGHGSLAKLFRKVKHGPIEPGIPVYVVPNAELFVIRLQSLSLSFSMCVHARTRVCDFATVGSASKYLNNSSVCLF